MEEQETHPSAHESPAESTRTGGPEGRGLPWRDLGLLLALMLMAGAIRVWQIGHTEVTARDSIGFIRYAWQLEHHPWREVVRGGEQHPMYPLAVLAAAQPVRRFLHGPESVVMQFSAQLASALAGVLLVIPMFYLGRELFDRHAAFWACVLFQCLPDTSRVLADGLSEAVFLLFAVTALLLAMRALRGNSVMLFVLCGLCSGLAYLTRPEGALIALTTGLVLLALQAIPSRRRSWRPFLTCGLGLAAALLVVGSPFVLITGKLTVKPTGEKILQRNPERREDAASRGGQDQSSPRQDIGSGGSAVFASILGVWSGGGVNRTLWGLWAVAFDLVKGFFYVAWLPALVGLWWFRDRFRLVPGVWVMGLVCLAMTLLLWRVAVIMGYVSDRHLILLILCGSFWAVAAVRELPRRCLALAPVLPDRLRGRCTRIAGSRWTPVVLLLVLAGSALPKSLETLHGDRAGFRTVGLWLGEHVTAEDVILDPYCWAHYYAGKVFQEGNTTLPVLGVHRRVYGVLERSANPHSRLPLMADARLCKQVGTLVYSSGPGRRKDQSVEVEVYVVPLPTIHQAKPSDVTPTGPTHEDGTASQ